MDSKTVHNTNHMPDKEPHYSSEQLAAIRRYEADVCAHMEHNPHRLAHSMSVAKTAQHLALVYDIDPFKARVAGILHDWEKVAPVAAQLEKARDLNLDFGVDLRLVGALVHGPIAQHTLAVRYPELSADILQAIARHTIADEQMSDLDKVVFVADAIEPLRAPAQTLEHLRAQVGIWELDTLFWETFVEGILYVLSTHRYLYPRTADIYNTLVMQRATTKEHA
ncbi:MAG: bis(5'-nucleosyl)-tetraphosphatase (symmetrical) YqeK [Atopobium sp.]|uniref:bis(5'-nucleosyl)-tetraphosphatase (symmetrical) YqeK n=1 Tax=Atopobium sp. TaxID=1872650 RepID=UPI002A80A281|nr:bis(5'-nucleosyl)-tetraphosphatase (symmetrical) YqeK [Atopobium sp.]MDY4522139.1 bis(5'-nucleosyl)-tetraphosphatase (symmetrical) YqeK [Atopobium sp.]